MELKKGGERDAKAAASKPLSYLVTLPNLPPVPWAPEHGANHQPHTRRIDLRSSDHRPFKTHQDGETACQ